jgi:hypothetical protein
MNAEHLVEIEMAEGNEILKEDSFLPLYAPQFSYDLNLDKP